MQYLKKYLLFVIAVNVPIIFLLQGCSVKKNTWAARQYHNTTARYNIYFNGYESLKEGINELSKAHEDNYNLILPIYRYGNKDNATAIYPNMDRAIEKASKAITNHSMVFKRQEYCKWIDDSYMLLGKANFFKREYSQAINTFDFVSKEYKKNLIRFDAQLWLAKSYIYSNDVSQAGVILRNLGNRINKENPSRFVKRNFNLVYAEYYIKMNNYEAAIEQYEKSLKFKQKKSTRIRINFILGQLYQHERQLKAATNQYRKVLKLNPPYEMAFNTRINMARCYDSRSGQGKNIRKELEKMLKDEKNKEYVDQIYYALAEIEIAEKDTLKAIDYLKLSVNGSVNNKYQKGMSFLRLGEIFFEKPDYTNARINYDSTVFFLPEDYPDFKNIKSLQVNLADLVDNLNTVKHEDSLQKLASMTEKERKAVVDGIIKKLQEEEARKKQEEILAQQAQTANLLDPGARTQNLMSQNQSSWYFNNTQTMSFGYSEFVRKWGQRKLEDLWRLSNKQSMDFDFTENLTEDLEFLDEDSLQETALSDRDPETYLRNIPTTPEKIEESNTRIIEALFNIGIIYRERIINNPKAAFYFEKLLSRYPENKYTLSSYYYLYKLYGALNIKDKETKYKNLIIEQFPESDFAQLILDPDYYKKIAKKEDEAQAFYKTTYDLYINGNYNKVIENYQKAAELYKGQPILIRFLYLKALSIGKTKDIDEFITTLKKVVLLSPESETGIAAQNTLDFLSHKTGKVIFNEVEKTESKTETTEFVSNYKIDDAAFHFFVIVVDAKSGDINKLRNLVSDHNKTYFALDKLNTTNIFLNSNSQMITVSNFKDKDVGMSYYYSINKNNDLNTTLETLKVSKFIISAGNYSTFYKQKDVDIYKEFFVKNYLN